jgi:GMP synthase-like glutamine amidotransferase
VFRDFFAEHEIDWDVIELDAGDRIPAVDAYDAFWVMGGPMDVWQEDQYPWLIDEKRAIRSAVAKQLPFLGFCLGHQLLAVALGGEAKPMVKPEVGIKMISLTDAGARDPLLQGVPVNGRCLQWHGVAVTRLPQGAEVLATSPDCEIQAFRSGPSAYGFQYHVECTAATVGEWGAIPEYERALDTVLGPGSLAAFEQEAAACLEEFRTVAHTIFTNFLPIVTRRQARQGR